MLSVSRVLVMCLTLWATIGAAHAIGAKAIADLKTADGRDAGSIKMVETTAGVLLRIKVKGLTPGAHALHIHETGKCEGDFSSAGNIYNPLGAKHGYLNDEGPMVGDLPNIFVGPTGEAEVELLSPFVTLNREAEETIFDADGTAFVIFDKADDYVSDPDGNGGQRVACGVISTLK
jgi:superoxide dismutase, Cu-Zn family